MKKYILNLYVFGWKEEKNKKGEIFYEITIIPLTYILI